MSNFWLRLITGLVLVGIVGGVFLCLSKNAFTVLLLAILLEILILEWPKFAQKNLLLWGFAFFYLILPFYLLILINQASDHQLLGLLLIVVPAFDMGAYLFGKLFGRHKLCPQISPNKSWEGVIGGFLAVVVVLCLAGRSYFNFKFWILALIITGLATLGDLFESWLKRRVALKDSGNLLPGHGGFLDRVDGLIFVTFFFYIFKSFVLN